MSSASADMNLDLHPDLRPCQLAIGAERAPLLVIDNFVANAEALVADACARPFTVRSRYFPGIRAEAPFAYQQLLLTRLRSALLDCLGMPEGALTLSMCHYSRTRGRWTRNIRAGPGYIDGSTDLFEQIAKQDGVCNRMLVYRRNSLHSGCIEARFVPDPNPSTGRLSINSFIDWAPT
ncbi:MAG TPA: DUF6445 family protein [Steroidobacteraceae bacterium]|nr:DUF6445 family protein [Steroidobacteraceae bacterium]